MDIPRKSVKRNKILRKAIFITITIIVLAVGTFYVSRLKAAKRVIDRGTLYTDTVKRGELIRNVRGLGTLVPEDIHWIPSTTSGRIEKIIAHPGDAVKADSILMELSNPDVQQAVTEADSQFKAAEA